MIKLIVIGILKWFRLKYFQTKWLKTNRHNHTTATCIFNREKVHVGKGTYGNLYVRSYGNENEKLTIGNYCSIADGVKFILGGNHLSSSISTFPFDVFYFSAKEKPLTKGPIYVADDVWIGTNAIILSGVTIGQGAIVGAGAVVTKDVPPYAKVAGVPARVIGYRFNDLIIRDICNIQFGDLSDRMIKDNINLLSEEANEKTINQLHSIIEKGVQTNE